MNDQMLNVIASIESHIKECCVLADLLDDKLQYTTIDVAKYTSRGYTEEEVKVGVDLIELYMAVKEYTAKLAV